MESKNLFIRTTCFEDLKYYAVWETQKDVTDFLSIEEGWSYEDIVRESILREKDDTRLDFTIVQKEDNTLIGRVNISRIDRDSDSLDITRIYIADKNVRGKGYGEEAMRLLLEYCFMTLHTERVTIDHYMDNKISAALFLKLGFQPEGVARHACKKNGKYYDVKVLSMLRSEYFEKVRVKKV